MENVSFITTENGDDLIVSFAIADARLTVKSLTLLRTPKYDFLLDDSERGVRVSYEDFPGDHDDLLETIEIGAERVMIRTRHRQYHLNIRGVTPQEREAAVAILKQMNRDERFICLDRVVEPERAALPSDEADDPRALVQKLWALEDHFPPPLREACLAAGEALVPDLIHELEAALDANALDWPSLYAVALLGDLGDSRAAPVLLRSVEQSEALEWLDHEASQALVKLGAPAIEHCLEAYAASSNDAFRDAVASILDLFEASDERIYEVFLETLERTSGLGANLLASYGDARAVPALVALFDELPVQDEDSPLANRVFIELRCAIEDLGGSLTAEQEAKFEASDVQRQRFVARMGGVLRERSAPRQPRAVSTLSPHRPVVRTQPKLGRNASCWCGSGKKYKKCHLDSDQGR